MKKDVKLFGFIGILLILVIALLIATWLNIGNKNNIESVVIIPKDQQNYESQVVNTYDEYWQILNDYDIWGKLTDQDFKAYDYLVDFIPYEENMQIIAINVNISSVVNIIYETNPKVGEESKKWLLNFIPISKGVITSQIEIKHEFK